ncbi:DNA repair protein RadC [Litoreibacter halocynthiae]|uniref:DNA repair protein RadC n=1 Tax=Litoreibacter halocynthiae TaxID=1242689 RepID=A0A4R7LFX8_9RHOB|nr:DNA repair protein RadC [Litoreibacter halocynthiae]TDT73241.1 DNA repair protein RadC [Litoreibacter halocynthiae]
MTLHQAHMMDALPGLQPHRISISHSREAEQHGHRKRVRDRFLKAGGDATPESELLELVLFRAIPRREVRSLARRLLATFGDFNGVIAASPNRLSAVQGVGTSVIQELKVVEAAAQTMARTKVMHRDVLSSWDALLQYCRAKMANMEREQFRVLFLDRRNRLIADEALQTGTVDHVPVYPREVIKRALELNASALILVHNHPSGDSTPSRDDIAMTRQIRQGAETLGLVLHDHLIIGSSGTYSFRSNELL